MKSFLAFDFPLQIDAINTQFTSIHTSYQSRIPSWSLQATRKQVAADFWLQHVLRHFVVILITATVVSIPFGVSWKILLPVVLICGCFTFLVLTVFTYGPIFFSQFLPRLEVVVSEQEKIFTALPTSMAFSSIPPKCKREQYSIPALMVIFYTFCKSGGVSLPGASEQTADFLNKFFGSDKDKLKQNLSRLLKLSTLSPKERAEILKGIDTAKDFFSHLNSPPALKIIDELELKLQRA